MGRLRLCLALAGCLVLAACGGSPAAGPSAASQAAKPAVASGSAQTNWDALVAAAKKEGKLTLAVAPGGGTAARQVIPPAFKEDFGIDVEVLVGPSSQLVSRLKLEQSSGLHSVDVAIGGADTMYQSFYGEKLIAPLRPLLIDPEVLNGANWTVGKPWFMDPDQQYVLRISNGITGTTAVNTKLVSPNEITSATDLLKPQFKGKLVTFDPTINGAGGQHAAYLEYKLGPEFIKKLYVDQQPIKTQDNRQLADWVGRGNYPVAIVMNSVNVEQLKADGLPVKEVAPFKDAPGYLTGGSGLMAELKEPPHPNAAQLFVNWMAMPHAQTVYNRAVQMTSPLTTVKSDWAPAYTVPQPGVEYTDTYAWNYVFDTYPKAFGIVRKALGAD